MSYKKIKSFKYDESYFREIWSEVYCKSKIITFDGIEVKFYDRMFDHCFYESRDNKKKDKSILSLNRLEKIYWIKDALEDENAVLKVGWDKKTKSYDDTRRVTFVKGNYIVVIMLYSDKKARFVTAYEVQEEHNLKKINKSPNWIQKKR